MENQKNKKFQIKEPINAFTHFLGFLMSIPIMITLTMKAYQNASLLSVIAFLIFGISLLLLYGASTIYHTLNISQKGTALLRRIDHMMIFVLIAGTYTPVCLIPLRGKWGWTLFIAVWGFAFAGILLKIFWLNAPRWFSTLLYVVMGWLVLCTFRASDSYWGHCTACFRWYCVYHWCSDICCKMVKTKIEIFWFS